MNRSRLYIALEALAVVWLMTACLQPLPSGPAAEQAPVQLKVALFPFVGNGPLFIAQEEGLFAEQGLAVEFVTVDSSAAAVPLVMQGDLDAAPLALNAGLFNAIARGGKGRIAIGQSQWATDGCTYSGIVGRKQDVEAGKFTDVAQWKGLTLATDPVGAQGTPGYFVAQVLQQGGLTLEDVRIEKVPLPAIVEALQAGTVDLAQVSEPWLRRTQQAMDATLLVAAEDILPDGQVGAVVFSPRLIEQREIGERFATAYLKAVQQYRQGSTPRNVEIVAKYTGLDPELIESICWSTIPADIDLNLDSILEFQQWAQEQGLLDRVLQPEEYMDHHFIEAANRALRDGAK